MEVKNVKLRERATRGLTFDGDSLLGFFDDPSEFSKENIQIITKSCIKTNGFCYVPPMIVRVLGKRILKARFRTNTLVAEDMKNFVENGVI